MSRNENRSQQANWLFQRLFEGVGPSPAVQFGEVWLVKNFAWGRHHELRHLKTREGFHHGLSIRPRARMMAFGTSKLEQARRSESRVFEVPSGAYPGAELAGAFLLDYAVPVAWNDCLWERPPALLPAELRQKLQASLAEGDGLA